jgi:glycogen debranching enzyme
MALKIAGEVLASNAPLGICTLDPEDWAYNGNYNNDDDGLNKATARGWNYHQGPVSANCQITHENFSDNFLFIPQKEWLWIAGSYMSAKLKVASLICQKTANPAPWESTLDEVRTRLYRFEKTMQESGWASLPELTNQRGQPCPHSCPAQAWSVGCALETCDTLGRLLEANRKKNIAHQN